jgi:EamA domain-containing membrane protein RarD
MELVYVSLVSCFILAIILGCWNQLVLSGYCILCCDVKSLITLLSVGSLTCMWFSISLSFTLYNKWILQSWVTGFNYPIIISTVHMLVKYVITRVWYYSPNATIIDASSWATYGLIIVPIGILTIADIVLSNMSIVVLPLSFYTMVKATNIIFTFFWAVVLDLEKFKLSLFFTIIAICGGIAVAVISNDSLDPVGVSLALISAGLGALRWVLLQFLLSHETQCKNELVALYKFSPICLAAALPFALVIEVPKLVISPVASHRTALFQSLGLCVIGGFISFALLFVELRLLCETSSLTMGVLGQLKEIFQIIIGMILFKDHLSILSAIGVSVSILAAYVYRILKSTDAVSDTVASPYHSMTGLYEKVASDDTLMMGKDALTVGEVTDNNHDIERVRTVELTTLSATKQ